MFWACGHMGRAWWHVVQGFRSLGYLSCVGGVVRCSLCADGRVHRCVAGAVVVYCCAVGWLVFGALFTCLLSLSDLVGRVRGPLFLISDF